MEKNVIITIGRQYGCGGRDVGKLVAEKLGIKYYDNELIVLAAQKSGESAEFLASFDEMPKQKFASMFSLASPTFGIGNVTYFMPVYDNIVTNDKLYGIQSNVIKEISSEACVIVGRSADYILKDKTNLVSVFLHADKEKRKERLIQKYNMEGVKNVDKALSRADKQRANYYNTYTDKEWGASESYDLCINTGKLSIEKVAELIIDYVNKMEL